MPQRSRQRASTDVADGKPRRPKGCELASFLKDVKISRVLVARLTAALIPHNNSRNCSNVKPASRTMPPIVIALIGLCRGIVRMRVPLPMTTCLP